MQWHQRILLGTDLHHFTKILGPTTFSVISLAVLYLRFKHLNPCTHSPAREIANLHTICLYLHPLLLIVSSGASMLVVESAK